MVVNSTAFAIEVHSCSLDGNVNLYTAVETLFFCKYFFKFLCNETNSSPFAAINIHRRISSQHATVVIHCFVSLMLVTLWQKATKLCKYLSSFTHCFVLSAFFVLCGFHPALTQTACKVFLMWRLRYSGVWRRVVWYVASAFRKRVLPPSAWKGGIDAYVRRTHCWL